MPKHFYLSICHNCDFWAGNIYRKQGVQSVECSVRGSHLWEKEFCESSRTLCTSWATAFFPESYSTIQTFRDWKFINNEYKILKLFFSFFYVDVLNKLRFWKNRFRCSKNRVFEVFLSFLDDQSIVIDEYSISPLLSMFLKNN